MKLLSVKIRGVTSYRQGVELDLSGLKSGTIAVIGRNGAGKTTLLECMAPAAIYRKFPTRPGTLADWSTGRDAFLEVALEMGGAVYVIRHLIDAEKAESEAYVTKDGLPLVSGKAREFEALMAGVFGPMNLFLAAVFSAQNKRGSLLELERRDRRDLFNAMLGNEYLQRLSERAGDKRKELLPGSQLLAAELDRVRAALGGRDDIETRLAVLTTQIAERQRLLAALESDLAKLAVEEAALRVDVDQRAAREAELAERQAERQRLLDKYTALQAQRREAQALAADLEKAQAAAAAIAAKAPALEGLRRGLSAADAETAELMARRVRVVEMDAEIANARRAKEFLLGEAKMAREQELRRRDQDLAQQELAAKSLESASATPIQAQAVRDLVHKRDAVLADADARGRELAAIKRGTDVLGEVPCKETPLQGQCQLLAHARDAQAGIAPLETLLADRAREAASLAIEIDQARKDGERVRQEAERQLALVREAIGEATKERDALAAQELDVPQGVAAADAQIAELERQRQGLVVADAEVQAARAKAEQLRLTLTALESELAGLAALERLLPVALASAKRVTELDAELAENLADGLTVKAKLERLAAELKDVSGALERLSAIAGERDGLAGRRAALEGRRQEEAEAAGAAKAKLAELDALEPERERLARDLAAAAEDIAQWQILEGAFGRDGIQALEIDAAGPEVSRLVNDLLAACYGDRFQVAIVTTEPKADGKGTKEVFDIKILDAEQAREGKIEGLSGGEKVIVNEAIGLGLAIYNARKNPQHFATIFRDETSGALDTENARRYVTMLARARQVGGIEHVFFITHQPELVELADHVIEVQRGAILLDGHPSAALPAAPADPAKPKRQARGKAGAPA